MSRLVACPDCGNMVSTKAVACPKCGRRVGRAPVSCGGVLMAALFVLVGIPLGLVALAAIFSGIPTGVDPDVNEEPLPAYSKLFVGPVVTGGLHGEILVPDVSRSSPASKRESIARRIARKEDLSQLELYSTEDAYKANSSASYLKEHPDAMKRGYLGSLKDGAFTPGEKFFP